MTKIIRNNRVYGGTPTNLGDIQNVDITSPTNNQALVYDSSTNKWKNDNVSAVGSLNDLTDVSISSVTNKQELVYDSTDSEFKNKTTRIELTQAEYNALANPLPDVDYYITDAPSMSGTSADLSYDGTTKSVYIKIEEMDTTISGKADTLSLAAVATSGSYDDLLNKPTIPSNAEQLPITSGSATNTKTYIDKIAPVQYQKLGKILNSEGGVITGCGIAIITLSNGIARIDFSLMIETADENSHSNWGINRDYFTSLVGKTITPTSNSSFTYYKPDGTINADRQGYGGAFVVANQFWKPARVYKSGSNYALGSWSDTLFPVGTRMVGTCYGTYT